MSNPWSQVYDDLRKPYLEGKMAKKDYDGDGKVESGTDEYMGSKDKAIKKAMAEKGKKKVSEHHTKDADGKVIEHGDGTPSSVEEEQINELSKKTLGGYIKKASKETRGNMVATQRGSGIPKKAKDIKLKQVNKRLKGMEKAGEKLAKEEVVSEADKKGKGSGSKDACYHKVKSRYSVWPSAYASGALVKCRKAGAKNWGNSSKKEEFETWVSELIDEGHEVTDFSEQELAVIFEGFKKFPAAKVAQKADQKKDTMKGIDQQRAMRTAMTAHTHPETKSDAKEMVKSVSTGNKKKGLERKFNAPSADGAAEKDRKNKAYKLEAGRRKDLDKRYGPKKEELESYLLDSGVCESVDQANSIISHMSDDWYETILDELYITEG